MNPTPKIVVTGFEPFAHGSENPTLEVLAQLRRSNDIEGELTTVQMPVDSAKLAELTSAKLDELQAELKKLGREDIMIVVGGVIPPGDVEALKAAGARLVFPPGTVIAEAALDLLRVLRAQPSPAG